MMGIPMSYCRARPPPPLTPYIVPCPAGSRPICPRVPAELVHAADPRLAGETIQAHDGTSVLPLLRAHLLRPVLARRNTHVNVFLYGPRPRIVPDPPGSSPPGNDNKTAPHRGVRPGAIPSMRPPLVAAMVSGQIIANNSCRRLGASPEAGQ